MTQYYIIYQNLLGLWILIHEVAPCFTKLPSQNCCKMTGTLSFPYYGMNDNI